MHCLDSFLQMQSLIVGPFLPHFAHLTSTSFPFHVVLTIFHDQVMPRFSFLAAFAPPPFLTFLDQVTHFDSASFPIHVFLTIVHYSDQIQLLLRCLVKLLSMPYRRDSFARIDLLDHPLSYPVELILRYGQN